MSDANQYAKLHAGPPPAFGPRALALETLAIPDPVAQYAMSLVEKLAAGRPNSTAHEIALEAFSIAEAVFQAAEYRGHMLYVPDDAPAVTPFIPQEN